MARRQPRALKKIPRGARRIGKLPSGCKHITFHKRGGKPVHVVRCEGRKLRGHNRKQCRKGGSGTKFKRMQFVKCR